MWFSGDSARNSMRFSGDSARNSMWFSGIQREIQSGNLSEFTYRERRIWPDNVSFRATYRDKEKREPLPVHGFGFSECELTLGNSLYGRAGGNFPNRNLNRNA